MIFLAGFGIALYLTILMVILTRVWRGKMESKITRDQFLKNQRERCNKNNYPHFMPASGVCYRCKKDIVPKLISKGNDGNLLVTGCPLCHASYCD